MTCKLQTPSVCLILNLKLLFISYLFIYLFSIYLFDEWITILCRFCNSILGSCSIGLVRCFEDIHAYLVFMLQDEMSCLYGLTREHLHIFNP